MEKLALCPTDAYSVASPASEALRTELDGGAGRYRADQIGASSTANVTFSLHADQYQYLYAFYRAKTGRGSEPFLIDLILDGAPRQERAAHFIPGSLSLPEKFKARLYTVTAQLEVDALEADDAFDNSVAEIYPIVDGDYAGYFAFLSPIPNIYWPDNYDISLGVVRGAGLDGHLGLLDAILEAWPER